MNSPAKRHFVQGRMPNPLGAGTVWASPQRDIAIVFPTYLRRAILMTQEKVGGENEELGAIASVLGKFVARATGEKSKPTVEEHAQETGLLALVDSSEYRLLCSNLMLVLLSAYYRGVRDATHPGETPVGIDELMASVSALLEARSGSTSSQAQPAPGTPEPDVQLS